MTEVNNYRDAELANIRLKSMIQDCLMNIDEYCKNANQFLEICKKRDDIAKVVKEKLDGSMGFLIYKLSLEGLQLFALYDIVDNNLDKSKANQREYIQVHTLPFDNKKQRRQKINRIKQWFTTEESLIQSAKKDHDIAITISGTVSDLYRRVTNVKEELCGK